MRINNALDNAQSDDILAVIVLYKMSLKDSLTFRTINRALEEISSDITIAVYDNSPVANYSLSSFKIGRCSIIYRSDVSNSGLSTAYNWASNIALLMNMHYLLLFDQDSNLPVDYFTRLLKTIHEYHSENLFVPILKEGDLYLSPCRFIFAKGFSWTPKATGIISIKGKSVFNSGICIKNSLYRELGGYDEKISLDFSDHYFISKYKKKYSTIVLMPIEITHSLSSFILDKKMQVTRFKLYCKGTKMYGRLTLCNVWFLGFWNFVRAVKLSLIYKDFVFISIYYRNFLFDENK